VYIRAIKAQIEQFTRLGDSTMHRDEVLAMSAKMAATTQNLKWVKQHKEIGPRIKATIEEIKRVSENDAIKVGTILTVFVDDKLDKMENEALGLVHQGKHDHAAALLQSPEYEEQRQAYNKGMKAFVSNMRKALEDQCDKHWKKVRDTFTVVGIVLLVIAVAWFVVIKMRKQPQKRTEIKKKPNAFIREWQETFNAITDGVCIIDKSGGKILQCNDAMTRFLKKPYNEIIGQNCCELLHGSSKPVSRCPLVRMRETRRSETTDFQQRWASCRGCSYHIRYH